MTWKEHYEELKPNFFSLKLKNSSMKIFLILGISLNVFIYIFFWEILTTPSLSTKSLKIYTYFSIFSCISIFFPVVVFKFILLYTYDIKIFYNKNSNLSLEFNQKKHLEEKVKDIDSKEKIFFITWLYKKREDSKLKRAIYFYSHYKYIQYLRKYEIDRFMETYLMKILIFTSIAFFGLMLVLTIDSKNNYQNIIFLYSIFYILYIIFVSYSAYSYKEQNLFFKENLIGFPEKYFLLDNNLDIDKKEEQKSFDVLAIVFGVLFTLYLTLAYNSIYNVGVDIKKISTKIECTNHNLNEKYQEENNALQ